MTRAITKKRDGEAMTARALCASSDHAIDRILRASFWSPRSSEAGAHHGVVIALPRASSR